MCRLRRGSPEPFHPAGRAPDDRTKSLSGFDEEPLQALGGWAGWVEALKIVEACYESSRSGKRVEMEWGKFDVQGKESK